MKTGNVQTHGIGQDFMAYDVFYLFRHGRKMKSFLSLTITAITALAVVQVSAAHPGARHAVKQEEGLSILRLYGPGGPLGPMKECADKFTEKTGTETSITTGTPPQWMEQSEQNGDLIFEGAEYMLNDFMQAYPDIVDEASVTGLYL